MKVAVALIYAMVTAPMAMAWGREAHVVIGEVATHFLSPRGLRLVRQLIPGKTLAGVSLWADGVKMAKQYSFTRDFHYIKTKDNPPRKCSFSDERDCKDGKCLVGAIARYTSVFKSPKKKSRRELVDAFKFLVHFIGDLSQPLHTSGHKNGGHSTKVKYGDITTSLHFVLDHYIPRMRIKENFGGNIRRYAHYLINRIKYERKHGRTSRWLSRRSIFDVNGRGNSMIAMEWAKGSNALSCSAVWSAYYANPKQDFSTGFYKKIRPIIDLQLAKSAYRLAFLINKIADAVWQRRSVRG
ncbi:hypothetical protein BASA50_004258 [Batrachochytrium salamandrivorans]|uniref:S1/P1 Nuclease n=1 Tax=Batrachochytrium salamandrivorans TaxID=1357716 RepID=A0ABQ8FGD6_9FUNG|nr:hypothetical protein BASA60_001926 [Batrachochytrium salamandrivorans]KAH6597652.1 hypothetical protein BASA50_004258 [Batrachochytrium salamandrivorans]KAJ1342575.1 hypothetical protein BSLG_002892 [Batrachochytrium salamandrivorans]